MISPPETPSAWAQQPLIRVFVESIGHSVYLTEDCHRALQARGESVTIELDYREPADYRSLTPQQVAAIECVKNSKSMVTQEEVIEAVRPFNENQRISPSTIWRWKSKLAAFGVVSEPGKGWTYDKSQDRSI